MKTTIARRRRNKRKRRTRDMSKSENVTGRAVKVRRRGSNACATRNQKGIE